MTLVTGSSQAVQRDRARALEAVRSLTRASSAFERASTELSLAHYRVLSAIAAGDERASRIATKLSIGRPAVSAAVEALSQRGLLTRSDVQDDHRAADLRLTAAGEVLLLGVEEELLERIDDLCARTPDGDVLLDALVWLGTAMDARRAERDASQVTAP
jgi:DNA-binding MarR family transcriptional regulator